MTDLFDKVTVGEVLMQLNPKEEDLIMIYRIIDGIPILKLKQNYTDFINDPVGLYLPGFIKNFDVLHLPGNDIIMFYI